MPVLGDERDAGVAETNVETPAAMSFPSSSTRPRRVGSDRPASASSRWLFPRPRRRPRSRRPAPRGHPVEPPPVRPCTWRMGSPSSTVGLSSRNKTDDRPSSRPASFDVCAGVVSPTTLPRRRDRDPIGDLQHLIELVTDEHDGLAGLAQSEEVAEELAGFLRCEHGRRLVEDASRPPVQGLWISTRCFSPTERSRPWRLGRRRTRRIRRARRCARWPPRDRAVGPPRRPG